MGTYLDHAATTQLRPEAAAAITDLLGGPVGNPSGGHGPARAARRLLDDARDRIAALVGAEPGQVVFTSGGTEADHLAVVGGRRPGGDPSARPACLASDHHAVLAPVRALGGSTIGVARDGRVDLDDLARVLSGGPRVVSYALVNNEVGTVQPHDEVAALVRGAAPDVAIHVDAVAAAPYLDLRHLDADLVTVSGHKLGAPAGIGALVVLGAELDPVLRGGGQERGRRGGTPNLLGAVALAAAFEAAAAARDGEAARLSALRRRLVEAVLAAVPEAESTVSTDDVLAPHVAHLCLRGLAREEVLFLLDRAAVAASAGSSCSSGAVEPSHVLAAMAVDPDASTGALRLSLGWTTTEAEVDAAVAALIGVADQLRVARREATPCG